MERVKLGIVGAGNIAQQHLKVLAGIPRMQPVGITSRTRLKAEQLAAQYRIPLVLEDMGELVSRTHPDALLILVSVNQIAAVTNAALDFRLPLFIEKPAGMLPSENEQLAARARELGVRTMVGFNRRYYSIFHQGIRTIQEHGPLLGVAIQGHERMWRIREGGKISEQERAHWIYANSVHTIDLLRFFGGEPQEVWGIAHRRFGEARGDQFAAVLEFDSGAIGQYSSHWYSPGGWQVVLYGDGVTVEYRPLEQGVWLDKTFTSHPLEPDPVDRQYKPGFYRQMEAFGMLVREGVLLPPAQDLAAAVKTMTLAERLCLPPLPKVEDPPTAPFVGG